jgi:trimeric autotransporter adhesin
VRMKMKTSPTRNSISRSSLRNGFFLIALVLACFALSPHAGAACLDGCSVILANTWQGEEALGNNTTGENNSAFGELALGNNLDGFFNTAIGSFALYNNTNDDGNTAVGHSALFSNSTGFHNTAVGMSAMESNTGGYWNTVVGDFTLVNNHIGIENTAVGSAALNRSTGDNNTAIGFHALYLLTGGDNNIAVGALAGGGTVLGTGSNNIDIGNQGVANESDTIRIGVQGTQTKTFIAGISGTPLGLGVAVGVNVNGQLGVKPSSARYKDGIKPMDKASEAILALRPVTFRYKHELDPEGIPQFGLVAEEVEKVNPDLVARDEQGKPYTVRYEAVNAMLLNEFLKEHRKVEQLEANDAEQQREIKALVTTVKEQESQIQKVCIQLESSKTASQVVNNQ